MNRSLLMFPHTDQAQVNTEDSQLLLVGSELVSNICMGVEQGKINK